MQDFSGKRNHKIEKCLELVGNPPVLWLEWKVMSCLKVQDMFEGFFGGRGGCPLLSLNVKAFSCQQVVWQGVWSLPKTKSCQTHV